MIAFEFTRKVCGGGGAKAEKAAAAAAAAAVAEAPNQHEDALFDALQGAFLTSLLHTYKSRCTQFLHFFACACRPAFAEAFAELLFTRLRADALHAEARISCAAYLASFLARAKFEHHGGHTEALCLRVVCELISWADEYQQTAVARLGGRVASTLDVRVHGPFYAVVQASAARNSRGAQFSARNSSARSPRNSHSSHASDAPGAFAGRAVRALLQAP